MKYQLKHLIISVFIITALTVFADETNDGKKFPGYFGLEFSQNIHFDTVENKPMVNYGWSDIYSKTSGKIFVDFPVKFYTITPWIKDDLELPMTLGGISPVRADTKNWLTLGVIYIGTINSDSKADGKWQNHIKTSVTFSL